MGPKGILLFVTLYSFLLSPVSAWAKTIQAGHWYPPRVMSKADDASSRLQFMAPHFVPRKATLMEGNPSVVLNQSTGNRLGINLSFTVSGVTEKSNGLLGLTSTSVPYKEDIVLSIVYGNIESYEIEVDTFYSKIAPWCVFPIGANTSNDSDICVTTQKDAEQVVDALATLGIAYGNKLHIPYGMSLGPEKNFQKHPEQAGLEAWGVDSDGPAAQAGIKTYDILRTVNGKPCTQETMRAAIDEAAAKPDGGTIHLEILRRGKPATADVSYPHWTMGDVESLRQQVEPSAPPAGRPGAGPGSYHLGINVRAVAEADLATVGLPKAMGLLVTNVEKGSLAENTGIEAGDVILQANGVDVNDADALAKLIRGEAVKSFHVWRKGQKLNLVVPESM